MNIGVVSKNFPTTHEELFRRIEIVERVRRSYPILYDSFLSQYGQPGGREHAREKVLDLRMKADESRIVIEENLRLFHEATLGILKAHEGVNDVPTQSETLRYYFSRQGESVLVQDFFKDGPHKNEITTVPIVDFSSVDVVGCPRCKARLPLVKIISESGQANNVSLCFCCDLVLTVNVN